MEEDGMVAIVQGLKDAGLAVTVMNRNHAQKTVKPTHASVATSPNLERLGKSAITQVHDDHYTSSYQLAHCNVKPSSPPHCFREFPPQRTEPCRNQGNFQVGEYDSRAYNTFSPVSSHSCRGGLVSPDRSSVSGRLSPSQSMDPFVYSLRRYPDPMSAEGCISNEIVQRLLSYTHNKNLSKDSKSGSLMQSHRKLNTAKDEKTRSTKNTQTYMKTKTESRDYGSNSNDLRFSFAKQGRSFDSTSPFNLRNKSEHHYDIYDYLNSSSRRYGRKTEVRYLEDVKKCIRDTITQICNDKPVVCPLIMNRYSKHCRNNHNRSEVSTSQETCSFCEKPIPCLCKKPISCFCKPRHSIEESNLEVPRETTYAKSDIRYGKQRDNESSNTIADKILKWLKGLPVYADDSPENKAQRKEMVKNLADKLKSLEDDGNYEEKAKEEIIKCIEKLPMWYPEAKQDQKMFKNKISDNLFNQLTSTIAETDDLKVVITQWLDDIQFESKVDKERIVENFASRLKPLVDKPDDMKIEIEDMLQELPILNKNKVIDKLANTLTNHLSGVTEKKLSRDKRLSSDLTDKDRKSSLGAQNVYEDQIWDWLEDIVDIPRENKKVHRKLVHSLAEKLQELKSENADEEIIQEEILDFLGTLSRKGVAVSSKNKNKLAKKLMHKIKSKSNPSERLSQDEDLQQSITSEISELRIKGMPQRNDRRSSLGMQNVYEDQVWDWLADDVDIPRENKKVHQKLVQNLAKKLQDLELENANDKVVEEEILDFLGSLSTKGVAINSQNKNELAKKLLNKIKTTLNPGKRLSQDEDLQQSIKSESSELIENIPSNISIGKRKVIKDNVAGILVKNIDHMSDKSDNIRNQIMNILKKEAKMTDDYALDLASALTDRIKGMLQKNAGRSSLGALTVYEERVWDWLADNVDIPQKNKKIQEKLVQNLAKKLQDLELENADDDIVEEEILDFLGTLSTNGVAVNSQNKNKLAKKLLNKIKTTLNPSERLSQDEDLQQSIKSEISELIENIPSNISTSKRKVIKNNVAGILVKNIDHKSDKSDNIRDEIVNILKKEAKMTEDEALDLATALTNRIKGMPQRNDRRASLGVQNVFEEQVWDWLADDVDVPRENKKVHQKLVQHLAKKLQELELENADDDVLEEDILDFLGSLSTKGVAVNSQNKNKLTKKLLNKIKTTLNPNERLSQDLQQSIKSEISELLENIPSNISMSKRKVIQDKVAGILAKNIDHMSDKSDNIRNEIAKTLKKEAEMIEDKALDLASALTDRIKGMPQRNERRSSLGGQNVYEEQVWDWLDKDVDIPRENKKVHQKLVQNMAKTLQELDLENADDEVVEEEILDFLGSLSTKGVAVNSQIKNKLAKKLLNKIKTTLHPSKRFSQDEDLQQSIKSEISELLENIPSNISISKRKVIKDKVAGILAKNIDHISDKSDNIRNEIVNTLKNEAKMTEDEAVDLASALSNRIKGLPQINDRRSSLKAQNVYEDQVWHWLADDVDIPRENKKVHQKLVQNLAKKLQELELENADDDIVEKEILDFLGSLSTKGVAVNFQNKNKLAKKLLNKIKPTSNSSQRLSQDEDLQQSIKSEISELVENLPSNISVSKRKVIKDKVADILAKNHISHISDKSDNIRNEILNILKKEAKMTEDEALDLAAIIDRGIALPELKSLKHDKKIEQNVSEEVSDILSNCNMSANKRKEVEKSITEVLADQIVCGTENKRTKENIVSILKNANVSDDDAYDISKRLLEKNKELLLTDETQDSKVKIDKSLISRVHPRFMSATARDDFEKEAEREILDFIENMTGDDPKARWKRKEAAGNLVHKLGEIICDPDETDTEKSIINEISQYLRKISIDSDVPREEMARKLASQLEMIGFQAVSTPKNEGDLFYPRRDFSNISSIYNDESSQKFTKLEIAKTNEENQYFNKLTGLIQSWIDELPIDISATMDKISKETMIQDLTEDVIDRQKYLQLNPNAKISDQEELEHLKYQVFRWLNKLLDIGNLTLIMQTTETLMKKIKDVNVPELVKPSEKLARSRIIPDSNLEDWFDSLSILTMNSTKSLSFENLKKEFTEQVQQIRQEDPTNEKKLKDMIREYLLKFPIDKDKKTNMTFINDKVEQLFKKLLGLPIETAPCYSSDNFIKKNVGNWMKLLPLARGKTVNDIPSTATDKLESAIANLLDSTNLTQIGDIKKTLEEETEKFLKNVPLDPYATYDVKSLVEALLNDVKEKPRIISNISTESVIKPPRVKKAADILFDNIKIWCDNLPIEGNTPEEIEKAKKIKQMIASKLIHKIGELNMSLEVFNDDFLYDNLIDDEIDNLLTDLSSEDIKNNLTAIKKDLMQKVKEARQKTQEEVAGQAYKQQLREAISKTLPSQSLTVGEQASFEVLKDNLADAFINLHYVGGNKDQENKYKTKINDEVTKFCNDYLKKHPASPMNSKILNQDLYNALKGVPIPKDETMRNEVELVKIKDEVNEWVKYLPLKEQTPTEKINTNKMIAVLTKKIHDIEKQKEFAPAADYDDKMRKEITKWVRKLPLNIDNSEVTSLTNKLINNLKSTEKSRRVSASTKHSIEPDTFEDTRPPAEIPKTCTGRYIIPSSTLSFEDREHLLNIRKRSSAPRNPPPEDATVSLLPVDAGSQTEIRSREFCKPCGGKRAQQNSGVQATKPKEQKTMQAVSSQAEVLPRVIVKEYYWDTLDESKIHGASCPFSPGLCMSPQMSERPISQQPSPFSQKSQSPCSPSPHMSPQISVFGPCASKTPTPQPRRARKEWEQPSYRQKTPDVSDDYPEAGTSRPFRTSKAKNTRLGSFDDMEPKCSRSRNWSQYPDDDDFWKDKSRFVSDEDDEPFLKERKKDEERVTCRCRERVLSKYANRRKGTGNSSCHHNDIKKCARCCGVNCPYPSFLYFK